MGNLATPSSKCCNAPAKTCGCKPAPKPKSDPCCPKAEPPCGSDALPTTKMCIIDKTGNQFTLVFILDPISMKPRGRFYVDSSGNIAEPVMPFETCPPTPPSLEILEHEDGTSTIILEGQFIATVLNPNFDFCAATADCA